MTLVLESGNFGLGNHLFSVASAYGLSKKYDKYLKITNNKDNKWLYDKFDKINHKSVNYKKITEQGNKFCMVDQNIIDEIESNSNITIKGYLQCVKYFSEYKQDILNFFEIPVSTIQLVKKTYPKFVNDSYFLHVRLGDYINNSVHFVNLSKYYETILKKIIYENPVIYLISNGTIDQIYKTYPILQKYDKYLIFLKSIKHTALVDMYIMSQCKLGCICANSTFSWWGAYLNQSPTKRVFMPSKWINMNLHNNTCDIYMNDVEIVDV